jgi:hypothetical protein
MAELRALPEAEDLLARLGRVVEATRTVVGVDGTGLTLTCEDGQPRWVAATDAAMQPGCPWPAPNVHAQPF